MMRLENQIWKIEKKFLEQIGEEEVQNGEIQRVVIEKEKEKRTQAVDEKDEKEVGYMVDEKDMAYKCSECNTYFILLGRDIHVLTEMVKNASGSFCSYDCYNVTLDRTTLKPEEKASLLEKFAEERK